MREMSDLVPNVHSTFSSAFAKTVSTWEHKPRFRAVARVSPGEWMVAYGTDDEVYGYVSEGTRPHIIRPRRARRLRFRSRYRARTRPRRLEAGPGGASGPVVTASVVHHPGTQAREFPETVIHHTRAALRRDIKAAFDRATTHAQK